jgi:ketosteroid isomerase-like protein
MGEWIETLDADIEWDISAHPLPGLPRPWQRPRRLRRPHGRLPLRVDRLRGLEQGLIDRGDDVVVIMQERARMPDSDMMLDRDLPNVWTVRDGRAVRFRVFKTRAEALEAVGLSG